MLVFYCSYVGEVQDRVQAHEESRVQRILVARLCAGPYHTQTNEVPAKLFDVIDVRLVKCCAGGAVSILTAHRVDGFGVVTNSISRDCGQPGRTFDDDVGASEHDRSVGACLHKHAPVNAHTSRYRRRVGIDGD